MTAPEAVPPPTAPAGRGEAALLVGLPGIGPHRLVALLDEWSPGEAWARATSGDPTRLITATGRSLAVNREGVVDNALIQAWHQAGRGRDPVAALARHETSGMEVLLREDPRYPEVLLADVEPPAVLFSLGDLRCLDGPRVAIVGTRRCTGTGAGMARELGHDLTVAGVSVVSGLALGIDGAAHRGSLDAITSGEGTAPPIGVVGSGLDVVYPARHRDLWAAVVAHGVLLSEAAAGLRPTPWRFPARNRIIAALADVVVVVESHAAGGSLLTVEEALRRDVPVMAVPGSVRSASAAGTNQLLADGSHPVRDVTDVLVALGLTPAGRRPRADRRPAPDGIGAVVLEAFDWEPASLEHLAVRTALPLGELALAVEHLVATGWVSVQGGWYERVARS